MKKCLIVGMLAFFSALTCSLAEDKEYTVKVSGEGENRAEALENAIRNAVREVVGTYVVTHEHITNDDIDEDIYINADAVVTKHKELKKTEDNGVVRLEIEATVISNDLLKYFKKVETTKISTTDTANLVAKRRALRDAEKSIDYIFKDYYLKLYRLKHTRNLEIGSDDDLESEFFPVRTYYEIVFDEAEYAKLRKRLESLLAKVCVDHITATNYVYKGERLYYGAYYRAFSNDHGEEKGFRSIAFHDKSPWDVYLVPNQIYNAVSKHLDEYSVLEFSYALRGKKEPVRKYLMTDMRFWDEVNNDGNGNHIEFYGRLHRDREDKWFDKKEFSQTSEFDVEQIRAFERCDIVVRSGNQARFYVANFERNRYDMQRLAEGGYVPAMKSMVDEFGEKDRHWYERAALMGDKDAMKKVGWENGGLGFSLSWNNRDDVWFVNGVQTQGPVRKNMVVLRINGTAIAKMNNEKLSQFVGNIPGGSKVSIDTKSGKHLMIKTKKL